MIALPCPTCESPLERGARCACGYDDAPATDGELAWLAATQPPRVPTDDGRMLYPIDRTFYDIHDSLEVRIGGLDLLLVLERRDGRTRWALGRTWLWWVWWAGEA